MLFQMSIHSKSGAVKDDRTITWMLFSRGIASCSCCQPGAPGGLVESAQTAKDRQIKKTEQTAAKVRKNVIRERTELIKNRTRKVRKTEVTNTYTRLKVDFDINTAVVHTQTHKNPPKSLFSQH